MRCLSALFVCLLFVLLPYQTKAGIIQVPGDHATIQAGVNGAVSGDTVLVAPGTYHESIYWPMVDGITLISSGDSTNTILDAQLMGSVITFPSDGTITGATLVSGFTLTGGSSYSGGGIVCSVASPTLTSLLIEDNVATSNISGQGGGGLYCSSASPTISRVTFLNNRATSTEWQGGGGAVYCYESDPSFHHVLFKGNSAGSGGALYINHYSNPTLDDVQIIENRATNTGSVYGGGGLNVYFGSDPVITHALFLNNSSSGRFGGGAILAGNSSEPTVSHSRLIGNTAFTGGAFSLDSHASIFIDNCDFIANSATSSGHIGYVDTDCSVALDTCTLVSDAIPASINMIHSISQEESSLLHSNIVCPDGYGILNQNNGIQWDGRSSWWDSPTGPRQPVTNPTGEGVLVNAFVMVTPWLTAPGADAPPLPPRSFELVEMQVTSLELQWEASLLPDFSHYVLYTRTGETGGYPYTNRIELASDTSYTLENLLPATTYHLTVTSVDEEGNESWYSNEIQVTTRITEAQNLRLALAGNEDLLHLIDHQPVIDWDYFDSLDEGQQAYQVQVTTDATFETVDKWESGWVIDEETSVIYNGGELMDGETLWLRARVRTADGFEGNWTDPLTFRMNTKPTQPVHISPEEGAVLVTSPELDVAPSVDADGDEILYTFLVFADEALTNEVVRVEGHSTPSWLVTPALPDNQLYWWAVRVTDGFEEVQSQSSASFLVNVDDDPPAPFDLNSPSHRFVSETSTIALAWEEAVDPDYGDWVHYLVNIALDSLFTVAVDTFTTTATSLERDFSGDDRMFWWKVRAQDTNTTGTWSTQTRAFQVAIPEPPASFTLLSPANESRLAQDTVTVRWSSSSDPDPEDNLRYRLEWSSMPDFSEAFQVETADTFYTITDLMQPVLMRGDRATTDRSSRGQNTLASNNRTLASGKSKVGKGVESGVGSLEGASRNRRTNPINHGTTQGLDALPDDGTVYWRVYVLDEQGHEGVALPGSEGWSFTVAIPQPPSTFSLLSPEDGSILAGRDTTLSWAASSDPDPGANLEYTLWWATDPDFAGETDSLSLAGTARQLRNLIPGQTYWWKVRARDNNTAGTWSEQVWSFSVDGPSAPDPFHLTAPDSGSVVLGSDTLLTWEATTDPDFQDSLSYVVLWANDEAFSEELDSATVHQPDFLMGGLVHGQTYWWKVRAQDSNSTGTWSSESWSFSCYGYQPPAAFSLSAPDSGLVLDTLSWTFSWDPSSDPDPGDSLTYWLALSMDDDFPDSSTAYYHAGAFVDYTIPYMADDTQFWWRVRALDTNSDGTLSNETWSFQTAWPQPPEPFALIEPVDGTQIGEDGEYSVVASWEAATDPDPGEEVRYDMVASLTLPTGQDTTLRYPIDQQTSIELSLPDSLQLDYWDTSLSIIWWVEGISGADTVASSDQWSFVLIPHVNGLIESLTGLPKEFAINALYPNPFNPTLTVVVGLPEASPLFVEVYNVMGRRVATLAQGQAPAGYRTLSFNGGHEASGVYFIQATVPGKLNQVRKVVLMK